MSQKYSGYKETIENKLKKIPKYKYAMMVTEEEAKDVLYGRYVDRLTWWGKNLSFVFLFIFGISIIMATYAYQIAFNEDGGRGMLMAFIACCILSVFAIVSIFLNIVRIGKGSERYIKEELGSVSKNTG